jgi:DNA processing protein
MEDRDAWLMLAHAPGLHAGRLQPWFAQGRTAPELLGASAATLTALGVDAALIEALQAPNRATLDRDRAWLDGAPNRALVVWGAADYPPRLAQIADAPLVLYVEGTIPALSSPQLAIVGSRNPTPLGRDTAVLFARELGRAGFGITSGLALGIDAAAHRGALEAGTTTVAVVGRGLDAVYPRENESLARRILAAGGALATDLPVGSAPLKHHFPRRNRILSGLAVGVLVVEAAEQSGSLITARLAAEQGREVFAMPGSIHNAVARGCHRLLRQGARLVETVDDIFEELAGICGEITSLEVSSSQGQRRMQPPSLDKDYEILLDALGFEPASLDAIVARTRLETGAVASMLLILELDGRIQQQPGGRYSRRLPGR